MKLFQLSILSLSAALLFTGCADKSPIERTNHYVYSVPNSNNFIYIQPDYAGNKIVTAYITSNKDYAIIEEKLLYSIKTNTPVCLKYKSEYSNDQIIGLCTETKSPY